MEDKPFPWGDLENWQLPSYCPKEKEAGQWGYPAKHPPPTARTYPRGFYFGLKACHFLLHTCLVKHVSANTQQVLSQNFRTSGE